MAADKAADDRTKASIEQIAKILQGGDQLSLGEADCIAYGRDMWPRTLIEMRSGKSIVSYPPDAIVWPRDNQELAEIVKIAAKHRTAVIPWGAGSGVCGASTAINGGIIVDMKRMNALVSINPLDHLVEAQCGILGQHLEDRLNRKKLTMGHFPSSIYCSTLGGWLATRSAGQFSSRYGKIEDMVESIECVTGEGDIRAFSAVEDPSTLQLLLGSEGTLGFLTRSTLRVHVLPTCRKFRAYRFASVSAGCDAMRRLMQSGLKPCVLRLYDPLDTLLATAGKRKKTSSQKRAGRTSGDRLLRIALSRAGIIGSLADVAIRSTVHFPCLLVAGFEGQQDIVTAEFQLAHDELLRTGGLDQGELPALNWYKNRYAVSYKQSAFFLAGAFVDTMEVAAPWSKLQALYSAVKQAISEDALVLAHFSHVYSDGCSIYFTFLGSETTDAASAITYDRIWTRALSTVEQLGGAISHHHGIGWSKRSFAHRDTATASLFEQLKQQFDPYGVLNPGKLCA